MSKEKPQFGQFQHKSRAQRSPGKPTGPDRLATPGAFHLWRAEGCGAAGVSLGPALRPCMGVSTLQPISGCMGLFYSQSASGQASTAGNQRQHTYSSANQRLHAPLLCGQSMRQLRPGKQDLNQSVAAGSAVGMWVPVFFP